MLVARSCGHVAGIVCVVVRGPAFGQVIVDKGGVERVMAAMEAHVTNANVQEQACAALCNLMVHAGASRCGACRGSATCCEQACTLLPHAC